MLEALEDAPLATIQDRGRPDFGHLGVPASGAADAWSLRIANLLLGNEPAAPALELTLSGPAFAVIAPCVVALAGADLRAQVPEEARRLHPGAAYLLRAGTTLVLGTATAGARGYLALPGGIDVPLVLGSASTYVPGGFGGIDGRPLCAGDRLIAREPRLEAAGRRWPGAMSAARDAVAAPIRVVAGPHIDRLPSGALERLATTDFDVLPESDRMGLRLGGGAIADASGTAAMVSQPVVPGAVQVLPSGTPVVLLADVQTVGGYPVVAVTAAADMPALGQLRPGERVRFRLISVEEAQREARDAESRLRALAAELLRADLWTDALLAAGG